MAAVAVVSQLTQALSFLKEHPKLSCVLLLCLSSPIYRILLYFSPLLLSTALCVFALITLTPYVTATDAEVERQSMLGASSQQHKKKVSTSTISTATAKERKLEDAPGYGKPSLPSSSSSSSSSAAASYASASLSAAAPSSSDAENSWFSWMKGLNDIGRTWMENKLIEQGLALSEPANRETLLGFIEGSFADLLTVNESPSTEIFAAVDNHECAEAVAESVHSVEKIDEAPTASTLECVSEGYAVQKSMKEEEIVCAKASSNNVDDQAVIENVTIEETSRDAENPAASITPDVCTTLEEPALAAYGVKFMQGNSEPLFDNAKVRKHKPHAVYEGSLPMMDGIPDMPAATIMPKTPSRIPAPSKLLEASRRIFSKEEQSKTLLPRAPLQASSAAKVNQPFRASLTSTQSRIESSVSVFKLPARKFLERSRSIPSKEGSKLSNTTLESQAGRKAVQGEIKESNALYVNEADDGDDVDAIGVRNAKDGIADVLISDASDFSLGSGDDGPRFDEDLKVEEAQALVQSELKMLEVELDEVAAKLPKLDEAFVYQKTPIKSAAMLNTPIGGSIKCNTTLLSASPAFKA